jgi:hypothetical protein
MPKDYYDEITKDLVGCSYEDYETRVISKLKDLKEENDNYEDKLGLIGDAAEEIYSILSSPSIFNKQQLKISLDSILFECGRKRDEHMLVRRASYQECAEEFHENMKSITERNMNKFLASTGIKI